ncbi:MAG: hypothetical protein ABI051_03150 [Vicinamibacterales bacterium]
MTLGVAQSDARAQHSRIELRAALVVCIAIGGACHQPIKSTIEGPPSPSQLAELWVEPEPGRDLYWGVGGERLVPDASAIYRVLSVKTKGFSPGYRVADPAGHEWSAKFYPESHTEVTASRLLWGIGYHQPPVYYVDRWMADGAPKPNPQGGARFRQHKPDFHAIAEDTTWPYHQNPFVGTRQLAGLLVLHIMLGNSDLKEVNNMVYTLDAPVEGATRWYVSRDLGHTFGRTGVMAAPRDDPKVFEATPFIKGVSGGVVHFDYRGRHDELFTKIAPADVRWICDRLSKLTETQWRDAFRAGGYVAPISDRYIARMKQKIAEGLALRDAA